MRANTKKRKKATVMLKATQEQEWWADQVVQVMLHGKRALDAAMLDVGRLVAETLMYMEREERSGPDYHPTSSGLMKWASQRGSIYVGDQKLCVEHPRRRDHQGTQGPIRQETHSPAMYAAQGSQHPTPPAQTLPQAGTPPLRDRLGAEQLQGREEDVAGVRALASRHQRVGGGFTPRSARGSADPPQAKGPRSAAQEPAFDESHREHVLDGFAVASATSNAIGTAKCASAGSPRCYCTANAGSDESRATHPLTQSSQPSMRSNARPKCPRPRELRA